VWVRIGDRQFRTTQMQLIFENGVSGGWQRTRVTLTPMTRWTAPQERALPSFSNLSGNIVFGGSGGNGMRGATVTCSRMGVDASPAPPAAN
jgi:hypothetical protein